MSNPFKYGGLVSGEYFFNREKEKAELHQAIEEALNVFLYAPRRYGKSSLALEVLREARERGCICVYLDLLKAPTKQRFLELYAREISKSMTTKFEERLNFCKKTFSRFIPKISLKTGEIPEVEFEVTWSTQTEGIVSEEGIDLPRKITKEENKRVVVVFDEFPEIINYDGKRFEGELRAFIQRHEDVCYIFTAVSGDYSSR
ncbi:TPA: hypothetical protein DCX15_05545 [bacterium]|nr:hypothetical protein [bacterium]